RGFTGPEPDAETGLVNMRGRIYDPRLGRFMQADPIMQAPFWSQGLNRYSYVFNNPLAYTDPSGCQAASDDPDYDTPYENGNFTDAGGLPDPAEPGSPQSGSTSSGSAD